MKLREIMETASSGATVSGSMAAVAQPLGALIAREQKSLPTKYMNAAPVAQKEKSKHASRQS